MARKFTRFLCLMLAFIMAFSMVACNSKKDSGKKNNTKKPTVSQTDSGNNDTGNLNEGEEILEPEEIPEEDFFGDDDFPDVGNDGDGNVDVIIPETSYSTQSPKHEEELEGGDDLGDMEDIDDLGSDRLTAVSLIQKEGKKVEGKNREFNIDTENVAYPDFRGLGTNSFPTNICDEAQEVMVLRNNWDYDEVNFQIEADRWNTIKAHYNRMWFDVHWFTTNLEEDYKREDIENNKDYQNYLNGVYDYETDYMQAMYKYLQIWQDAGTITALNYSWKVGEKIQEWFGFPGLTNAIISAPYNLDAYAESCVDLLQYLRDVKGFTNVECLTFYNEPHYEGDFDTFSYEPAYWVAMVKRVEDELKERGIRDDIEIWANEHGSIQGNPQEFAEYIRDNAFDTVDMWAFHSYYSSGDDMKANNYSYWYHFWSWMLEKYGKKIYVTETYASSPTYGDEFGQQHAWRKWTDSRGSQIVCAANVGLYGVLDWGMTGGYVPKPVGFTPSSGPTAAWDIPCTDYTVDAVQHNFFDQSLITNYIPSHSDVLMVDWTGDDLHGSAFKLPDGGYTILIDAAGNIDTTVGSEYEYKETTERNITFNMKGLNKDVTFYRYSYDPDEQVLNAHATVNQHDYKVKTKKGVFKDTIDKDYGMYVYTTMAPIKQIEIKGDSVLHNIPVNSGTYQFDASLIDCSGEIVWSIAAATDGARGDKMANAGSINANGLYTVDANAKANDKIAIRASLKSDPSVYDVVMIRIVKEQ